MSALAERGRALRMPLPLAVARSVGPIAAGIIFAVALQALMPDPGKNLTSKLVLDIGINIILAVSLNMVNGFTGQFSMGHAGFMAVGGYTAAAITYYGSFLLWDSPATHGASGSSGRSSIFCT